MIDDAWQIGRMGAEALILDIIIHFPTNSYVQLVAEERFPPAFQYSYKREMKILVMEVTEGACSC
jgi:hypothetical protein